MSVGLPGTGISGIFYLAAALLRPVLALVRWGVRRPVRWRAVVGQFALAGAILVGIWLTGWLVGLVVGPLASRASGIAGGVAAARYRNVLRGTTLMATCATLAGVLLAVQIARLVVRRFRPRSR
jgi:hypothetical protein